MKIQIRRPRVPRLRTARRHLAALALPAVQWAAIGLFAWGFTLVWMPLGPIIGAALLGLWANGETRSRRPERKT